MEKRTQEWMNQADYDMETAVYMSKGGRHVYAVFMCHLAVEKALKGLFYEMRREVPPKSHNLIYLLKQIGIKPPAKFGRFIVKLTEVSVAARYPESLAAVQKVYTKSVANKIIEDSSGLVSWIKSKL